MDDRLNIIRKHPVFQSLSEESQRKLAKAAEIRKFIPGDRLITEGEFNDCLLLILDGQARVENAAGEVLGELGPGDIAGEISSSGMSLPVASVVAVNKVGVLAFPVNLVADIAFEEEEFAEALRKLGMQRVSSE